MSFAPLARRVAGSVVAYALFAGCGLETGGLLDDAAPDAGGRAPFGGAVDAATADDASSKTETGTGAGEIDAAAPLLPELDASPSVDASLLDASTVDSATTSPCDLDGDGHRASICGGDDCCDLDPDVYPRAASTWWTRFSRCGTSDFDCDGQATKRYPEAACAMSQGACVGEGFMGMVPCGTMGLWQKCAIGLTGQCAPNYLTGMTKPQECR